MPAYNFELKGQRKLNDCGIACASMIGGICYDEAVNAHNTKEDKITYAQNIKNILERCNTGMTIQITKHTIRVDDRKRDKVQKELIELIQRMKKSLLIRVAYKDGGGHWVIYDSNPNSESERIKDPYTKWDSAISFEEFFNFYFERTKLFQLRKIIELNGTK